MVAGLSSDKASPGIGERGKPWDTFTIHVMPHLAAPRVTPTIAVFDPTGETMQTLGSLGVSCHSVGARTDLDLGRDDILVIGKGALTVDGPGPDVRRVRDGLKVIVFEQTGDVLEKRFGFRIAEYGLRQLFPRVPDHPLLEGLDVEGPRDWRGKATIRPPRLVYSIGQAYRQTTRVVQWCGLDVPRVWRCGRRGNVASVLIEKPAKGDFLPILDGGFSLQYSPLLEYREGKGVVLFCQVDVTGRTESDPAAGTLVHNLVAYVSAWQPAASRKMLYVGELAGQRHLEFSGIPVASYEGGKLVPDQVLVVGRGGGPLLARRVFTLVHQKFNRVVRRIIHGTMGIVSRVRTAAYLGHRRAARFLIAATRLCFIEPAHDHRRQLIRAPVPVTRPVPQLKKQRAAEPVNLLELECAGRLWPRPRGQADQVSQVGPVPTCSARHDLRRELHGAAN